MISLLDEHQTCPSLIQSANLASPPQSQFIIIILKGGALIFSSIQIIFQNGSYTVAHIAVLCFLIAKAEPNLRMFKSYLF